MAKIYWHLKDTGGVKYASEILIKDMESSNIYGLHCRHFVCLQSLNNEIFWIAPLRKIHFKRKPGSNWMLWEECNFISKTVLLSLSCNLAEILRLNIDVTYEIEAFFCMCPTFFLWRENLILPFIWPYSCSS